jgi:hypothetical protein
VFLESNQAVDPDTGCMVRAASPRSMNLARLPRERDPHEARKQVENSLDAARRCRNQRLISTSLLLELAVRRALGESARTLLNDATALVCNSHLAAEHRVDLLIELSEWERESGYRDAAVVSAFEGRRQAESIKDDTSIARATLRAATAAVFSGVDRQTVLAAFDEAIYRFVRLDQPRGVASAYLHSGIMLLLTMDDAARAAERFARIRELNVDETPAGGAWACARNALEAIARTKMGRVDIAERLVAEAAVMAEVLGPIDERIPALVQLARGVLTLAKGDTGAAIAELELSVALGDPLDMPEWTVEALRQLCRAHYIVGDNEAVSAATVRLKEVQERANRYAFSQSWWDNASTDIAFDGSDQRVDR